MPQREGRRRTKGFAFGAALGQASRYSAVIGITTLYCISNGCRIRPPIFLFLYDSCCALYELPMHVMSRRIIVVNSVNRAKDFSSSCLSFSPLCALSSVIRHVNYGWGVHDSAALFPSPQSPLLLAFFCCLFGFFAPRSIFFIPRLLLLCSFAYSSLRHGVDASS